jgi:flagellar basal-body rod protein FlgC
MNIKSLILAMSLVLSASAFAMNDCQLMRNKEMEMDVISSNIDNVNTTRTDDGGPYKEKKLICSENMCAIISYNSIITKHLPGHPDANKDGDVKFPDIDLNTEMKAMIEAKSAFEQAARNCKAKKVTLNGV